MTATTTNATTVLFLTDEHAATRAKVRAFAETEIGNSHIGNLHGVVVRTGPGSRGLSAFLVEADRPGVSLAPHQPAMGLHGFSFGEVTLDGCRVPAANMIGDEGDGLDVAYSSSVLYGRPNLAAVALGIDQAIVEQSVMFAQDASARAARWPSCPPSTSGSGRCSRV